MPAPWIALRLPLLPLEALSPPPGTPNVVFERRGNRRQVLCANALATAAGIVPGMEVAAASALSPALQILERKPVAERAALAALATAAYRFSGSVSTRPTAPAPRMPGVWLEAGSSLRLFKGLEPLLAQLHGVLEPLGYSYRLGVAPTPDAAALVADANHAPVPDLAALAAVLHKLPLEFLEIPDDALAALRGSGLRTAGAVLELPINELAMRFGQALSDYLGRLTGRLPLARRFFRPPERYSRRFEFDAELESFEALLFPIRRLLLELQQYLIARDTGVREFTLELEHADAAPTVLTVGMSAASRDAAHLQVLLRERLERAPMPGPVRALTLRTDAFAAPQVPQRALFETRTAADEEWLAVLDRLKLRLGAEAVRSLGLNDDYRPEKSYYLGSGSHSQAIDFAGPGTESKITQSGSTTYVREPDPIRRRPLWLLPVPRPLTGIPQCLSGPERLESGWWDGLDATRDYYQAQAGDGARLWVYRDRRNGNWFLQGLWS